MQGPVCVMTKRKDSSSMNHPTDMPADELERHTFPHKQNAYLKIHICVEGYVALTGNAL